MMQAMRHLAAAISLALLPFAAQAERVAILPVKLLDTSHEARDQQADHRRRLDLLARVLQEELGDAVLIAPEAVAAACRPETTECLLALGREQDSQRALFIVVQKTSTLILQVFANLVDTGSGELILGRNLNFRGDNDEAWRRAGRFLARQMREAD